MPATADTPDVRPETLALARKEVAKLLSSSAAFRALEPAEREEIAGNTARIAAVLAEPAASPLALESDSDTPQFEANAAREGAEVAGLLLQQVNFPQFVSSLVTGVFDAIVESSIKQMQAYGELVANVGKTLNEFRDENVSANQGRDHLVEQFPDVFQIDVDTGEDGNTAPRVHVKDGVDEDAALKKINGSLPLDGAPLRDLDDETVEERCVPAARTQLATSRQQLLATMVLMGINRIVVTDGRIAAKVMYDFTAKDNFSFQKSATKFDYGDQMATTETGQREREVKGGETSGKWGTDDYSSRGASYYTKGEYQRTSQPVLKLASATREQGDSTLSTRASLAGNVEVNFKSDYLPLEKMADSFQIARIQDAAQPGQAAPPPAPAPAPAPTPPPAAPKS